MVVQILAKSNLDQLIIGDFRIIKLSRLDLRRQLNIRDECDINENSLNLDLDLHLHFFLCFRH